MRGRFCDITNLLISLRLNDLPTVDIEDFDLSRDVLIFSNFMTNSRYYKVKALIEKGARFVFNSLWDCMPSRKIAGLIGNIKNERIYLQGHYSQEPKIHHYHVPMFFWYNESLNNDRKRFCFNASASKLFLMPMKSRRLIRDKIWKKLQPYLKDSIASYVDIGITLPGDVSPFNDRYFLPDWYENTCFSLVIETEQAQPKKSVFITEKTFKPIACGHPFLILGHKCSLELLREAGYRTFDTLFDESYDKMDSATDRMHAIIEQVANFDASKLELAKETAQHNYDLFNDHVLIRHRIQKEIVQPLREFVQ